MAKDVDEAEACVVNLSNDDGDDRNNKDNKTKIFQQAKSWLIIVGDGDVLPALEMGIRFMQTGQTALIWCHSKYAMGPGTRTYAVDGKLNSTTSITVPPRSAVAYKVKVIQKVMDTSRLNPYFTLQKAETKKKIANDVYQHEWCPPPTSLDDPDCQQAMARSIRLYTKAAKEMEALLDGTYFQQVEQDHPQRKQCEKILLDSLNNIVAVYLRQKEYGKAKQSAVNVLSVDSGNLKALLRAAKAALLDPASSYEEVEAALKAADDEITYKNPQEENDLKKLKALFKRQKEQYKERTKAMFGNKLSTTSKSKSTSTNQEEEPSAVTTKDTAMNNTKGEDISKDVDVDGDVGAVDAGVIASSADVNADGKTEEEIQSDEKDRSSFWWSQLYAMIGQVIIPLILVLLYRYVYLEKKVDGN
jgi:hypothetical protein